MSLKRGDDIKRWTAKRKSALVLDIIQGKTIVAEASRAYDLSPSEVEGEDEKWPRLGAPDDPPGTERRWLHRLDLRAVSVVRYSPAHGVLQADESGTED